MADPATMMGVSMGTSVLSSIIGASGASQSAQASVDAYRYKASLALMNQRINKQNAAFAREAGDINAMESGLKSKQQISATKVKQASSGFDVNSGTNAQIRSDQGDVAKFDQDMIRFDAAKTAYGYEAKAAADEAESNMMLAAASNAQKAGEINVFSSILGGASSVAGKWMQGSQLGMFGGSSSANIGIFDPNNYGAAPTWTNV